jgi:hypothetical protein
MQLDFGYIPKYNSFVRDTIEICLNILIHVKNLYDLPRKEHT